MNHYHIKIILCIFEKNLLILCVFNSLLNGEMKEACDLMYPGFLSELHDSTIRVPDKAVVYMPADVKAEMGVDSSWVLGSPPSIFFLIQHSESIETKDRLGKRFTFAQALIDSVKEIFPKAEVGIAVFREYLYFDPADNPRFVKAPGNDTGAYIPLFRLDSSYAPDGKFGYEIVRELLDTVMKSSGSTQYADLKYTPSNLTLNPANTNINCGFDAVKHAFKSALYRPNHQFVIFFSDGEANIVNGPHTNVFEYQDSVRDVPTTLTAYSSNSGTAHQSLVKMTTNIQNNGYSCINPKTALYPISSDTLMQFILNNIVTIICQVHSFKPIDITFNGQGHAPYDETSQSFHINNRFPLTGLSTIFNYRIYYKLVSDSIDMISGDTLHVIKDSTSGGSYTVLVDPATSHPPTNYKHQFDMNCWKRELALNYNSVPITLVNKTMNNLELRFIYSPDEAQFHYTKADIEVSNRAGTIKDKETFSLTKNDTLFTKTFSIAIDSNPTPNNGVLQVHENDTIIAVFRNNEAPKLPLDTIRIAVPFIATSAIQSNPIITNRSFSFCLIKNGVGNYRLKYNNLPDKGMVTLYTIIGRTVFQRQISKGCAAISLPNTISPSVYILQITYGKNDNKRKILFQ